MTFDNSPPPTTSTWATIKDHLPIFILGGGLVAFFIGSHAASTAIVAGAAFHIIAGVVALAATWLRKRHSGNAGNAGINQ